MPRRVLYRDGFPGKKLRLTRQFVAGRRCLNVPLVVIGNPTHVGRRSSALFMTYVDSWCHETDLFGRSGRGWG